MLARYVPRISLQEILAPDAPPWGRAKPERLTLMGTPVGLQPTAAIRAAWSTRKIGAVPRAEVAALHNGETLAFRITWADESAEQALTDTTAFADAAAVLLPVTPEAPIMTMGAPGAAVNAWYWRADEDGRGREVVAEGLGTTRPTGRDLVQAHGVWKDGRWQVVIARALRVEGSEPGAQLQPGTPTKFGVAIWNGSHRERAGIKSFSGDWRELQIARSDAPGRT